MQGRPPRSRNERNQPQSAIISEQELKFELERQAESKRQEKRLREMQEKEELLRHYQNNALAMPQADPELQEFVQLKQENLNYQYQQQFPGEASKSEQQRQLRLKLREEERLRRQNGLSSAYEQNKEPLPFQLERKLKENYNSNNHLIEFDPRRALKEELFSETPQRTLQQNFYAPPVEEPAPGDNVSKQSGRMKESQRQYRQELDKQVIQKEHQVKPYSQQSIREETNFMDRFSSQQQQRPQSGRGPSASQPSIEDRRMKMADQVMQQLTDNNNCPPQQNGEQDFRRTSSRQTQDPQVHDQKRKYREELERQIAEKNQQKEREKMMRKQQETQPESRPSVRSATSKQLQYDQGPSPQLNGQSQGYRNEFVPNIFESNQNQSTHPSQQQLPTPGTRHQMPPQDAYQYQQQIPSPNPMQQVISQQDPYYNAGMQQQQSPRRQEYYGAGPSPMQPVADQFQFNEADIAQGGRQEKGSIQNYARTRHVTATISHEDSQRQKMQRQQYAEELKRQVEEQKSKKKLEEERQREEEEKLQRKIQKEIEEEKLAQEQKQKAKVQEVVEHQVANKQLARRMQEPKKEVSKEPVNDEWEARRDGGQARREVPQDEPKLVDERKRKRDLLFGSDDETQAQMMQPNNRGNVINFPEEQNNLFPQQVIQQQQPQQLAGMQGGMPFGMQVGMQGYQNFPQNVHQQQQQFSYQQPPPLSPPFQQQFFDQVQHYHDALFNPTSRMTPQNMQIHQNYLLQLMQNRQEIEIVRQILEEKLRIQQIEMQNQLLVEEYRNKVREIKSEEQLFQKEIVKLQAFLTGNQRRKEPLNPSVFQSALQLSVLGHNRHALQPINESGRQAPPPPVVQRLMPKHAQPKVQQWQAPESQVFSIIEEDVELPGKSDYVAIENNSIFASEAMQGRSYLQDVREYRAEASQIAQVENIDEFQMVSSNEQLQNDDDDDEEKNFTEQLNGYDVNLLRTQDYMNMFRQNIQSQSRQQELKFPIHMLKQNSNSLENMSQIESKPLFSQWSQMVHSDNQERKIQKQGEQRQNFQEDLSQSQLAVSASIPLSRLQGKEIQMSEAVFQQDPNTLILPDDEIGSEEEVIQANRQMKPQTPVSNYNSGSMRGEYESQGSKKFKKPKTIDIFNKLESQSKPSLKPLLTQSDQEVEAQEDKKPHQQQEQLQLAPVELPPKQPLPPSIHHPQEAVHNSQHLQSMSNYTQLNPLTSQTTFIVQQENKQNFLQEIDQSKVSVLNQSKRLINTPSNPEQRRTTSRKQKQLQEARKEDSAINQQQQQQLDVLKESRESEPNGNSKLYKPYDFKYEESVHQFDFQQQDG